MKNKASPPACEPAALGLVEVSASENTPLAWSKAKAVASKRPTLCG